MLPEIFKIGPVTIHSFGMALAVAFLLIAWLLGRECRRRGRSPDLGGNVTLAAMIGGVVGAKIYYLIDHGTETLRDPLGSIFSGSGLTYYGGLIGGAIAVILVARRNRIPLDVMGDIGAPFLALGYGVGRIGCFLNGDDYGKPTESWFGMAFPKGQPPTPPGVEVIPTQAIESAAGLALFAFLWSVRKRWEARPGRLFGAYLVLAGLERFLVEYLRTNEPVGPLTAAQWMSAALVSVGIWLLIRSARAPSRA